MVFHANAIVSWVLLFKIARKWPLLVEKWHQLETEMVLYGFWIDLYKKLRNIFIIFISFAASTNIIHFYMYIIIKNIRFSVEHFLAITSFLKNTSNIDDVFRSFYPEWFKIVDYSLWIGILLQVIQTIIILTKKFLFNLPGDQCAASFRMVYYRYFHHFKQHSN